MQTRTKTSLAAAGFALVLFIVIGSIMNLETEKDSAQDSATRETAITTRSAGGALPGRVRMVSLVDYRKENPHYRAEAVAVKPFEVTRRSAQSNQQPQEASTLQNEQSITTQDFSDALDRYFLESTSTDGLESYPLRGGGYGLSLQGGFASVFTAEVQPDGSVQVKCGNPDLFFE